MGNRLIYIILFLVVIILLILDALAIHDISVGEPDLLYEFSMIVVSIVVFIAIGIYIKQRKQKRIR